VAGRVLQPLEDSYEAQRQFVANASHELRTPLTRQRALIQVALADPQASFSSLRAAHERVLASEQHLEQMIDALLTLTRGQAGLERRERLDLATLASQALLARESELAGRDLDVRATLATAPTAGDPRLIERLIANLIDNAIRHNTPADMSRSPPGPATGTPSCRSRTPARPSRPKRSSVSSSPSNDWAAPAPAQQRTRTGTLDRPSDRQRAPRRAHARARPQGGLTIEVSFPPHARASGKVLLAHLAPDALEAYLRSYPLVAVTDRTIVDSGRFAGELAHVRELGFATDVDEFVRGVSCISVPVLEGRQSVIAAYTISAPSDRYAEQPDVLRQTLLRAARSVSRHARGDGSRETKRAQESERISQPGRQS
jgi:hypothetical protein